MFWEEQKVKKLISMFALSAVIALPAFADGHKAKVGMITTLSGGGLDWELMSEMVSY